ncbi:ATP-binding protein [Streptomyces sp. NPDC052013]|uniref:ATP-binding protein n=1 Tax=Streptomyces sp. NPDC052013 TaxID=3365679 RepID=UPI0037D5D10E
MTPLTTSSRQPQDTAASRRPRVLDLPLEHGTTAPAAARHVARPVLTSWGLTEEQIYDTLLVISEMVTNAITHAAPPVVLHLHATRAGGQVTVRVSDGGPQPAPATWAAHRPEDEHGRGTLIVTALTHDTGAEADAEGLIDRWADLTTA